MKNLFGEVPLRVLAFVLLLAALVLAFIAVRVLIVPFVAAMFVVYLFDPGIAALQRRGLERGNAFLILLMIALVGITIILMFAPAWLRLEAIGGSSDTLTQSIQTQLARTEHWVDSKFPMLRSVNITGQISARAATVATNFFEELPGLITSLSPTGRTNAWWECPTQTTSASTPSSRDSQNAASGGPYSLRTFRGVACTSR